MKQAPPNINYYWASLLMEELYRCGVRHVGIAPGSRSSPLAEAAAAHGELQLVVHPDERGLAFHMLGCAAGSGRPAVIVTTSGTAVANLFPAIAEAHHAGIPLTAITADRPPELRDCGANQATDQVKLFGSFVRSFTDLPVPDAGVSPTFLLSTIDAAVDVAVRLRGPVHLNAMFREPLAPVTASYPFHTLQRELGDWPKRQTPWVQYESACEAFEPSREVLALCERARRGCILVGAVSAADAEAIAALGAHLGWPVLPDIQSGLRFGEAGAAVIPHADIVLASKRFAGGGECDFVLQFGSGFVTRRFLDFAASPRALPSVVVDPATGRVDPQHRTAHRIRANEGLVAEALRNVLPGRGADAWLASWQKASARVESTLAKRFATRTTLSEPGIAWTISRALSGGDILFFGNSLPVRMLSTFASASGATLSGAANRGLSGIDGQVATAVGYALGAGRPVTLVLGDLSLLHDLNSLALLREARVPVTVVVINNDGGGIFSLLPIAESANHFEKVFGVPHGIQFRAAADLFGLGYSRPASPDALARALKAARKSGRSSLIELITRRSDTARETRQLVAAAARAVDARGP